MLEISATILGGGGVGKSALTIQLIMNHFMGEYDPTIEDSYRKQLTIDDATVLLEILDTASREEFTAMRDQYYRRSELFYLVYSITSLSSFEEIPTYREQILRVKEHDESTVVIIGNKLDLEQSRQVPTQAGADLARQFGKEFFETSALTRFNVEEAFFAGLRARMQASVSKAQKKPGRLSRAARCDVL